MTDHIPFPYVERAGAALRPSVRFVSAAGGVGCSTVALLAGFAYSYAARTLVVSDTDTIADIAGATSDRFRHGPISVLERLDLAWDLGPDDHLDGYDVTVVDRGRVWWTPDMPAEAATDDSITVLSTAYPTLRATFTNPATFGRPAVIVRQPSSALTVKDAGRALDAPEVFEIPWDPALARMIDAGLVLSRYDLLTPIVLPLIEFIARHVPDAVTKEPTP